MSPFKPVVVTFTVDIQIRKIYDAHNPFGSSLKTQYDIHDLKYSQNELYPEQKDVRSHQ